MVHFSSTCFFAILLCLSFYSVYALTSFHIANVTEIVSQESSKVTLALYYEALCPDCQEVITGAFSSFISQEQYQPIKDITAFIFVPFGNAKPISTGGYSCQHGTPECDSNVYEGCALKILGNNQITAIGDSSSSLATWPFILCLEANDGDDKYVDSCITKNYDTSSPLTPASIQACFEKDYNEILDQGYKMTQETCQEEEGCHTYVPWVTVDGKFPWSKIAGAPTDANDLAHAICAEYYSTSNKIKAKFRSKRRNDELSDACAKVGYKIV